MPPAAYRNPQKRGRTPLSKGTLTFTASSGDHVDSDVVKVSIPFDKGVRPLFCGAGL
jgi:hypothetical protein